MARRKTQWIDTVETTIVTVAGAAAPGTVSNELILSEAELENVPNSTLIRVVGTIWYVASAGAPIVTAALWLAPNYTDSVLPLKWDNDEFQRGSMLWTDLFMSSSSSDDPVRRTLDIRSKRRMTQGSDLTLSFMNHAVANNDVSIVYHLRCLLLLP